MLSFGTKKKKRSWREMAAAEEAAAAEKDAEGGEEEEEEELDEKTIEEELRRAEQEEEEERQRLQKIKEEAEARRAARKAKAEQKRKEEAAAAAPAAAPAPAPVAPAAAAEAVDDGTSITAKMCRQGRCVRVDNVNFKSTEDDIRMLFEGFGRIERVVQVRGAYGIAFANDLSAEEAMAEQATNSTKGVFLHQRQLVVTKLTLPEQMNAAPPRGPGPGGMSGQRTAVSARIQSGEAAWRKAEFKRGNSYRERDRGRGRDRSRDRDRDRGRDGGGWDGGARYGSSAGGWADSDSRDRRSLRR